MSSVSKKTASMEGTKGSYTFEIIGYCLIKGIGLGKFIQSTTFTVGGYVWAIFFYPDGLNEASKQCVPVYLKLMSSNTKVHALYDFRIFRPAAQIQMGVPMQMERVAQFSNGPVLFRSCDVARFGVYIQRSLLEQRMPGSFQHNRLRIECDLTIMGESEIEEPPFDIMVHFGKLLKEGVGADVTFIVGGETFTAHKIVLAARSPVFMAEFYGQMRESGTDSVTIEDMQPAVFNALLHFIYNDLVPDMSDLEGKEYSEMIWHLLVAADRYALERLKLVCQSIIGKNLDVQTVATTLALADQHSCDRLKDACIKFIASSKDMDAVIATEGYAVLKRTCPSIFVDLFEKTSKLRRI
ncbi:hypothetical protein ACP4OV_026904 [Aristida adscensionis]